MDARSQLAGRIAMSTTSVAVVYAVMLELGINTWLGKRSCRLLCHRSGNRYCSGANFRPLYAQNRRIYRRHGGGGFSPSLAYPRFFKRWRSAF
jgi:hypothetical protein